MNYYRFISKCIIALLSCIIGLSSCGDKNKETSNEIHYTTIDNIVLPFNFGEGRIVSNSYVPDKNVCILKLDKDVTEIEKRAFCDCTSLTSITIPPSVTKIGISAFYGCSSLTSITIPPSVTRIGEYAFCDCSSLTSITVSKENKFFDSREDCNAIIYTESNTLISGCMNTVIPPSVTKIGDCAFDGCSSLTSISIPPSVTEIGSLAFSGCSSLTSITVSKENKFYDSREDCDAIIHTESNTLICGCKNTIIPPSVTKIEDWAFSGCSSLTSISIPESVTEIGWSAFNGCSSLTEVHIPKDCNVYCNAFQDCPKVQIIRY